MPSKSGFRGIHMSVLLFSDSSTKCLDVFLFTMLSVASQFC